MSNSESKGVEILVDTIGKQLIEIEKLEGTAKLYNDLYTRSEKENRELKEQLESLTTKKVIEIK